MSRVSQVTSTEGYLASLKQVDAQYIHASSGQTKEETALIVVTKS